MAADVINLRQARKAKARKASEKLAQENRAKFGRTKRERKEEKAKAVLEVSRLDGHRRDEVGDARPKPDPKKS